jgi:aldehyde dehydrogenase (NAD+)
VSSKHASSKRQSTRNATAKDEPFGITNPSDVPAIVADLRKTFNSDHTLSKSWRLTQLKALKKMLVDEAHVFQEASIKDLQRSHFEHRLVDIQSVINEANFCIRHLDEWMADSKRATNLISLPARSLIKHDPLGVVLIIGAWNYNVTLSLQPLCGAIAAGNCAVLKPGDFTPHLSEAIARMVTKYLDPRAIRCVTGDYTVSSAILDCRFDMIFFTGSTRVGKIVAAAAAKNLTPVVLELGGKSPCIVDKSTDVKVAAQRIIHSAKMNAGQTCVRPDYIMVHDDVADEFVKTCRDLLVDFYGKDPKTSEWFSRVVNDAAFQRITGMMEKDSKYIVHGGKTDASERYIEPTLVDFGTGMYACMYVCMYVCRCAYLVSVHGTGRIGWFNPHFASQISHHFENIFYYSNPCKHYVYVSTPSYI